MNEMKKDQERPKEKDNNNKIEKSKNEFKRPIIKQNKERPLPSGEETNIPKGMGPEDKERMKK